MTGPRNALPKKEPDGEKKRPRCNTAGCQNTALWSPVLVLRAPVEYEPCGPARASLAMVLCNVCKHAVTLADFLGDEGWAQIQAGVRAASKVPFDRSRTTLDWQTIPEMREFFDKAQGH